MVWHTAALQRVKKLPKLEKFMIKKNRERQTPKQMKQIIQMYHVLHGGTYSKGRKGRDGR